MRIRPRNPNVTVQSRSSQVLCWFLIIFWTLIPPTFATADPEEAENEEDINSIKCASNLQHLAHTPPASVITPADILHYYLNELQILSSGHLEICNSPKNPPGILETVRIFEGIHIRAADFKLPKEKADLIVFFIPKLTNKNAEEEIRRGLESLRDEHHVQALRYVTSDTRKGPTSFIVYDLPDGATFRKRDVDERDLINLPWYFKAPAILSQPISIDAHKFDTVHNVGYSNSTRALNQNVIGYWTWPYFRCGHPADGHGNAAGPPKWLISYTTASRTPGTSFGLLSFDIDLTYFPINQCEMRNESDKSRPMAAFYGTHKCDLETTNCLFLEEKVHPLGWLTGSYKCKCKESRYASRPTWNNKIPGSFLESTWCAEQYAGNEIPNDGDSKFHQYASCVPCQEGCPDCTDDKSCMAEVNHIFRMTILCLSILCTVGSLGLIAGVYHCRKHQIFSASSPIFLCICLFGCCIMYTEIIVLFPVLSSSACIAVKWTRHLGFCVTYTALYMKLCRVYLTFRVKSAHKIKLTEKHLLHWMSPIMVIMLLYLFAWTISATPDLEVMRTHDHQRLYQCVYNWWDHVLSMGEIIFLAYGVFICWRIRENHDAQFISYSIYNIALVNVFMVTLHLMIMPKAGPDMKYLLAFVRVQMSTTVTIALVLGSKVYRAYRGDYPTMKEIANSANGFGGDVLDLGEENQQLKEELQKMAYQMEKLKSYAMTKNNRHISHSSEPLTEKMENLTSL